MRCEGYRLALSADLDGEPLGLPALSVHGHLAGCRACATWYESAAKVTRAVRLAPAAPAPDLVAAVLAAVLPVGTVRRGLGVVRAGLVVVGLLQAALAWPAVVLGRDPLTGMVHAAHETGAWNLALAVAFLGAAARTGSAGALVGPLGTFVGVLAFSGSLDLVAGAVAPQRLATHLVAAAGVALLVAAHRLTRPGGDVPSRRSRRSAGPAAVTAPVLVPASRPTPAASIHSWPAA